MSQVRLVIPPRLYADAHDHLVARAESAGFFLADWDGEQGLLRLRGWQPVQADGLKYQSDVHVSLTEATQTEIIRWAWDNGAGLVEAHSHGGKGPACFSPSDLSGFAEWVPHVWWRLQRRPYVAMVVAGSTFDGLAWISAPQRPQQVAAIDVDGRSIEATRETLSRLKRLGKVGLVP